MTPRLVLETLTAADWDAVGEIYRAGIETGDATFETTVPSWTDWDAAHLATARLVARQGPAVVGWVALSPVSGRCVYGGVAETSVYVSDAARGQGVGRLLLEATVEASEREGLWTLQAGIFPENTARLSLHRACGFRVVGTRERLGRLGDRWRDVVLLERRSNLV